MSKVAVIVMFSSGLFLSVDCGGGSSGSGFHTSVASNKPLNQLSSSETKQICTEAITYLTSPTSGFLTKETTCRAVGVELAALSGAGAAQSDAQIQAACQAGYAICEASDGGSDLQPGDGGAPADQCANPTPAPADCTATVAQYSACINELTAGVANLFPPCNQLTAAKAAALSGDGGAPTSTTGPACQAFEAACPDMTVGPSMMTSALRAQSGTP
jgi:hypothetical protein